MNVISQKYLIWTRPLSNWKDDFKLINAVNGDFSEKVKHLPLTENFMIADWQPPETFDYAILTSAKAFSQILLNPSAVEKLKLCAGIFCVGAKTAQIGIDAGLSCVFPSPSGGGQVLWDFIQEKLHKNLKKLNFWLPQAEHVAFDFTELISANGGFFTPTIVYKTKIIAYEEILQTFLKLNLPQSAEIVFAFASPRSAGGFLEFLNQSQLIEITKHNAVFLGIKTAQILQNMPFKKTLLITENPSLNLFVENIFQHFFQK